MFKHLLAGVTALGLMTGVALAQGAPGSGSSTTTVTSSPNGGSITSTAKQGTGWNGNQVTKKDTYNQGSAGSSEPTRKLKLTCPAAGQRPIRPLQRNHNNGLHSPALRRKILA